jgi:hypothetical protein
LSGRGGHFGILGSITSPAARPLSFTVRRRKEAFFLNLKGFWHMDARLPKSLVCIALALWCAAALAHEQVASKASPPADQLRPVAKQELLTLVPSCFAVSYGPSVWLRVDDQHWLERYKDGTESKYKIMGRTKARGRLGTVVAKIAGDPKKTGNGNDGRFQVFIPDKGATAVDVLFRHLGQDDNYWYSLAPMRSAE